MITDPAKLLSLWKRFRAATVAEGDRPTVDTGVEWLAASTALWSATFTADGSGVRDAVATLREMLAGEKV